MGNQLRIKRCVRQIHPGHHLQHTLPLVNTIHHQLCLLDHSQPIRWQIQTVPQDPCRVRGGHVVHHREKAPDGDRGEDRVLPSGVRMLEKVHRETNRTVGI
uniref:(northern house mosquito) hypothetical protein n=1 Tax=Culex pipiens TaxID=7175 RepID=A0A8D8C9L6_CULPI